MLSYFASFSFYYHFVSYFFLTGAVVIPTSQLKHENLAAPGLVLRFLAIFWGNASLAEFSCSPITALMLPHPSCLFLLFILFFASVLRLDCYVFGSSLLTHLFVSCSLFVYKLICFLDPSCWVSSVQCAQPGREQWREVGCCSDRAASSAGASQTMACILQ